MENSLDTLNNALLSVHTDDLYYEELYNNYIKIISEQIEKELDCNYIDKQILTKNNTYILKNLLELVSPYLQQHPIAELVSLLNYIEHQYLIEKDQNSKEYALLQLTILIFIENLKINQLVSQQIEQFQWLLKNKYNFSSVIQNLCIDTLYMLQITDCFYSINDCVTVENIEPFNDNSGFVILDLSNKKITSLEDVGFIAQNIQSLILHNNCIRSLKKNSLIKFSALEKLNISYNPLQIIEQNSLPTSLKEITLNTNQLIPIIELNLPLLETVNWTEQNFSYVSCEALENIEQFVNTRNKKLTININQDTPITISPAEKDTDECIYIKSSDDKIIKFPLYLKNVCVTINNLVQDFSGCLNNKENPIQIPESTEKELVTLVEILKKIHEIVTRDTTHEGVYYKNRIVRNDGKYIVASIYKLLDNLLKGNFNLEELAHLIKLINFLDIVNSREYPFLLEAGIIIFVEKFIRQQKQWQIIQTANMNKLLEQLQLLFTDSRGSIIVRLVNMALECIELKKDYILLNKYELGDYVTYSWVKAAKDTLKCRDRYITTLDGIECVDNYSTIEKFDLSKNYIKTVPKHYFKKLSSLKIVNLKNNCISTIEDNAFSSTSIKEIDLSKNKINTFNLSCLKNMPHLEIVDLRENPLESFNWENETVTQQDLPQLHTIKIEFNSLNISFVIQLATLLQKTIQIHDNGIGQFAHPFIN